MGAIQHDTRYPLFFVQRRGGEYAVVAARYSPHGIPLGARTVAMCDTHEGAVRAMDEARKAARATGAEGWADRGGGRMIEGPRNDGEGE